MCAGVQMRNRNAGPSQTKELPLFATGGVNRTAGAQFLENAQHTTDWAEDNDVIVTGYGGHQSIALLPRGAPQRPCSNDSLATMTPLHNKLFSISNLRVVAKGPGLCVLGNATDPITRQVATPPPVRHAQSRRCLKTCQISSRRDGAAPHKRTTTSP